MGKMNLLKANWVGKVGQTVGAKWKNLSTIRTFTKPAYSDTPAQQVIRTGFSLMTSFVALFADQIKSLSALDTKGMSVRNAILKLNKAQIILGTFTPSTLQVSRGGLPNATAFAANVAAGLATFTATWTAAVGATISTRARMVVIAVDEAGKLAYVGNALNTAATLSVTAAFNPSAQLDVYFYLIDYRGSTRVGSVNGYTTITTPAA